MMLAPRAVAVLDAGGHFVALKREDGSGIERAEIAMGKAWGALGMADISTAGLETPNRAWPAWARGFNPRSIRHPPPGLSR